MNLDAFEAWLVATGYRRQTVDATVADARQALAWDAEGRELPARLRPSAQRVLDYLDGVGSPDPALVEARGLFEALAEKPATDPRARRLARKARRKREARSIGDAEWQRLVAVIEHDPSTLGAALLVLAQTGLRVGDLLRLPRARLAEAQDTGRLRLEVKGGEERTLPLDGAPDAWGRLWVAWQGAGNLRTVAWLVAPRGDGDVSSKGAAYKALARHLGRLADEAEVTGRVHLHRLRRTVGVQALRVTEDVVAVQQLLGHASSQTTLGYLDEARPDRVAEVQRQVRARFAAR